MKIHTAMTVLTLSSISALNQDLFLGTGYIRKRLRKKNNKKNRYISVSSNKQRRLQEEECLLLLKKTIMEDKSEAQEVDCYDRTTNRFIHISGLSENEDVENTLLSKFNSGKIVSGQSTFLLDGAYYDDDASSLIVPSLDGAIYGEDPVGSSRRLAETIGTKEMVAIRIVANDVSTTASESEISDSWFGTYGDPVNLKTQIEACSFKKLVMNAAETDKVSDGVYTVTIPYDVNGAENAIIRNAAIAAAEKDLGGFMPQFDHVMLCIPPGTRGSWIAYAYVNFFMSVYNDEWCTFVSGQMHEIAHNLNLAHSGETRKYDDLSGMLGMSYNQDDGPHMCFNGPKNWQLGWYSDRQKSIGAGTVFWSGKIYGLSDYGSTPIEDSVIVQLPLVNGNDDYYVTFNRQSGINSGTMEGGNLVLVHSRPLGLYYAVSTLRAKLGSGGSYSPDGITFVTVNEINFLANPAYANVTITKDLSSSIPTISPSSSPTNLPSRLPTSPSSSPTNSPSISPTHFLSSSPTYSPSISPAQFLSSSPTYSPSSPPASSSCEDYESWTDRYGDGCVWFEEHDEQGCPNFGDLWDGGDGTPNVACCYCGGGNDNSDTGTPTTSPMSLSCEDDENWTDRYGDSCVWFEEHDEQGCPNFGDLWDGGNGTPNEACCYCGGGNDNGDTGTPTTSPISSSCEDYENWTDIYGDGCVWFEEHDGQGCPNFGNRWDGGNGTPNEACCYCGGGDDTAMR